jgi:hypothetical protein
MVVARVLAGYLFFMVACSSTPAPRSPSAGDTGITTHAAFPDDEDAVTPTYDKAELEAALAAERAALEKPVAEDDYGAVADAAVRHRFVASLEECQASGRRCPPRLDDPAWSYDVEGSGAPKLDTQLRFDLEDWRKVAAELHGRACACRTIACVDSLGVAIDVLEKRPMPDVEADDTAAASIARARTCLMRLRGRVR